MQHCTHDKRRWARTGDYEKYLYNANNNKDYHWNVEGEQGKMAKFIQKQINLDIQEEREPSKYAMYIRKQYSEGDWRELLKKKSA